MEGAHFPQQIPTAKQQENACQPAFSCCFLLASIVNIIPPDVKPETAAPLVNQLIQFLHMLWHHAAY